MDDRSITEQWSSAALQRCTPQNLFNAFENSLPRDNGYSENAQDFDPENRQAIFTDKLLSRFTFILEQAEWFYIENSYTERTWGELFSLLYASASAYATDSTVIRIHFWNVKIDGSDYGNCTIPLDDQFHEKGGYLGFVTLRKVRDYHLALSFVLPNWIELRSRIPFYICAYERIVHVAGHEYKAMVTPFYSQDSILGVCAHADLLMVSLYMHHGFGYPLIDIADMLKDCVYEVPNRGLNIEEMQHILINNKTPCRIYENSAKDELKQKRRSSAFSLSKNRRRAEIVAEYRYLVETNLMSGLPVMLVIGEHVVVVFGLSEYEDGKLNWVIFDDSAFLTSSTLRLGANFFSIVNPAKLIKPDEDNRMPFLIYVEFEKIFLNPVDYKKLLESYSKYIDGPERSPAGFLLNPSIGKSKTLICRNAKAKCHIMRHGIYKKQRNDLVQMNLPEYVYFTELPLPKGNPQGHIAFIADPRYPPHTIQYATMFHNMLFPCFSEDDELVDSRISSLSPLTAVKRIQ